MLDLYKVGTIAKIKQVVKLPKHVLRILVEGLERAELLGFVNDDAFLETEVACYEKSESIPVSDNAKEAMLRNLKEIFLTFCQENQKISSELANADSGNGRYGKKWWIRLRSICRCRMNRDRSCWKQLRSLSAMNFRNSDDQ